MTRSSLQIAKQSIFATIFVAGLAITGLAHAASTVETSAMAASAISKDAPRPTVGKVVVKPVGKIGATVGHGDKEYPAGTIPTPPKPKKEELEGAVLKANVAKP